MPDLTLAQRFGTGATLNTTDANNPKLVINLKDFQNSNNGGNILNGLGLDNAAAINSTNINAHVSKILYALLLLNYQNQATTNNDPTVGVYMSLGGKRFATRNNISQTEYRLVASVYKNDSEGMIADADSLAV